MYLLPLLLSLLAAEPSTSAGEPSITLGDGTTTSVADTQSRPASTGEAVSPWPTTEREDGTRSGADEAEPTPSAPLRFERERQFPHHWIEIPFRAGVDVVGLGFGAMTFPSPHLGVGGLVMDTYTFGRGSNNRVQLLPKVRFVLLPFRKVTPYLRGAMGLAVFNRGLGAYANWMAGTGLMIRAGRRVVLDFGIDVEGLLPAERFSRRFECTNIDIGGSCSVLIVPRTGIMIRLGGP